MWKGSTRVGTLRALVRGGRTAPDQPWLRLRLSGLVQAADLDIPGLPPSAVLVVRRLRDPMPGRLRPRSGALRPDEQWSRAVRSRLEGLARQAVRPLLGPVPAGAEAVLFADPGELLACLARDLGRGDARGRWWWQALLRELPPGRSAALHSLLRREAALVPAALSLLHERGGANAVLLALSPPEAAEVALAVGRAYDLPDRWVRALLAHPGDDGRATGGGGAGPGGGSPSVGRRRPASGDGPIGESEALAPRAEGGPAGHGTGEADGNGGVRAPGVGSAQAGGGGRGDRGGAVASSHAIARLREGLLPSAAGLPALQRALLGLALALVRSPGTLRGALRRAEEQDREGRGHGPDARVWAGAVRGAEPSGLSGGRQDPGAGDPTEPEPGTSAGPSHPSEGPGRAADGSGQAQDGAAAPGRDGRGGAAPNRPGKEPGHEGFADQHSDSTGGPAHSRERARHRSGAEGAGLVGPERGDAVADGPVGSVTRLGGILYLVNLVQRLDLPAALPPEGPGAWAVLEALARGLLDGTGGAFCTDPIWRVLAELDGRPPDAPLTDVPSGEDRFALPGAWLDRQATDARFRWAVRQGRLCLWLEGRFLVVDQPVSPRPTGREGADAGRRSQRDLAAEVLRSCDLTGPVRLLRGRFDAAPLARLTGPLTRDLGPGLRAWLSRLLPYIHHRLLTALGLTNPEEIPAALLLAPGEVVVTRTHVDLIMPMEAISLRVRMAGLDCDPGWAPDFGRVVRFHFHDRGEPR